MTYLWLKAGHIIFVVFWMAGLFVLPRQMLYMHDTAVGSDEEGQWVHRIGLLRKIILTPEAETDAAALQKISEMWRATGAHVESMNVTHHDRILAATSHLPHMLAFSLVSHLSKMSDQDEIFSYAAGGFRDFF